jgi:hypothetical protein
MLANEGLAGLVDAFERGSIDVVEHDMTAFENDALKDVAKHVEAELGATGANQDNA